MVGSFQPYMTLLQPNNTLIKLKNINIRMYHPWSSVTDGGLYDYEGGLVVVNISLHLYNWCQHVASEKLGTAH